MKDFENNHTLQSRYHGCLLGLAVGDALGAAIEGEAPGEFEPVTEMRGGGRFNLEPGEWTDDTSMALCLAESLLTRGKFDPQDQMRRYLLWKEFAHLSSHKRYKETRNGQPQSKAFDCGATVKKALQLFSQLEKREPYCGAGNPGSAGNGSLMRLAPIPLFFRKDPYRCIRHAQNSSRTTHDSVLAHDACRGMAAWILRILEGQVKEELFAYKLNTDPLFQNHALCPQVLSIFNGSYRKKSSEELPATGYVLHTLEAALWAFMTTDNFQAGALKAVNLGHDADTTGAVYGQLAGAYYGAAGIPSKWVNQLARKHLLVDFAEGLYQQSQKSIQSTN